MSEAFDEPSAGSTRSTVGNVVDEADLERVLREAPKGAAALCGMALALILIAWLAVYFGVFLPRGPVS